MTPLSILCGKVTPKYLNQTIRIQGFVHAIRNHGTLIFIDLEDASGWVQVLFHPEANEVTYEEAKKIKPHSIIQLTGTVTKRDAKLVNPKIATGEIEVIAQQLSILNLSAVWPFELDDKDIKEETRLRYRYLDLRRPQMQHNIRQRHNVFHTIRQFLNDNQFIEIETPILNKSTPEGARDFLVPSRLNPEKFYALPQSPQIFKQILVGSRFEKYYQIARCFRDEDMRADRQLEFTQLDLEMAFATKKDVLNLIESLFCSVLKTCYNVNLKPEFPKYTYNEAIQLFGSDAPDIRFDMKIHSITQLVEQSECKIFQNSISQGGIVLCLKVDKGAETFSRKHIDALVNKMIELGGKGLAWSKVGNAKLESNISKNIEPSIQSDIIEELKAKTGDLILFLTDENKTSTYEKFGQLRLHLGNLLKLNDPNKMAFTWVTDFPLFHYNDEEHRFEAMHHPFTRPTDSTLAYLDTNPAAVQSEAYDLVLNGVEIGGGSLRIHEASLQKKVFELLKLNPEEIESRFGFLIESLAFGQPPHGGIALGLDRIVMLLQNETTIRNVIAFPKTQKGICSMSQAPTTVNLAQLNELFIQTKFDKPKN